MFQVWHDLPKPEGEGEMLAKWALVRAARADVTKALEARREAGGRAGHLAHAAGQTRSAAIHQTSVDRGLAQCLSPSCLEREDCRCEVSIKSNRIFE